MEFRNWLENNRQEYITEDWESQKVTFRWLLPGYAIEPRHRAYKKENEFGSLQLEPDPEHPGYLFVVGADIDPGFQRKGYGEALYRYALQAVKQKHFKGISSHVPGRRGAGVNKIWQNLGGRREGDWEYLD